MVEIRDVLSNSKDLKSQLGWATEATLSKLYNKSGEIEKDFENLLDFLKVDEKTRKKWHEDGTKESRRATRHAETYFDDTRDISKTQEKATRKLGYDIVKSVGNLSTEKAGGLFDVFATPLKMFSDRIQIINPALYKWTNGLAIGLLTLATMYNRLQAINDSMREMYANGIRLDVTQNAFIDSATDAGMTLAVFAKMLTKYSNVTAALGVKGISSLTKNFAEMSRNGADFMMTNEEAQEALLSTMNLLQTSGVLVNMSEQERIKFSKEYINQLNDLAAATGRNRDEIAKSAAAASQLPPTFMALRALPPQLRDAFQKMIANATATFGQEGSVLMENVSKYMAGGVGLMDKNYQLLFTGLGNDAGLLLRELGEAGKTGDTDRANKAMAGLAQQINKMDPVRLQTMMRMGDANFNRMITTMMQESQKLVDIQERERKETANMTAEQRKAYYENKRYQEQKLKDEQAAFNKAQQALAGLRNSFDGVIARLEPVLIPALNSLVTVVKTLLDVFNGFIGAIQSVVKKIGKTFGMSDGAADDAAGVVAVLGTGAALWAILKASKFVMGRLFTGGGLPALGGGGGRLPALAGGSGGGALGALGKGLGGLGRGVGALGGGAGGAINGILSGLASGLTALGKPQSLLGVVALAGIGASMWIAVQALKGFSELSWETIGKGMATLLGLGAIGAAAGALSAILIPGALAIGALGVALIPVAAAARIAAPAMESFGNAIKLSFQGVAVLVDSVAVAITKVIDAFTNMQTAGVKNTTDQIERLSKIPGDQLMTAAKGITAIKEALEGFSPGIMSGFNQFMGSFLADDPIAKLQRLADMGNKLGTAAINLDKFKTSLGSIMNPSTIAATPISQGNSPTITTDQLNIKTLQYYEDSIGRLNAVIEQLEMSNASLETIKTNADANASRIATEIQRTAPRMP